MKTEDDIILIINRIIEKNDPMGLIALGCPKNEYHPEAKKIADILIKDNTMVCSSKIVHDVLLEMFDKEFTLEECTNIAKEITKALFIKE